MGDVVTGMVCFLVGMPVAVGIRDQQTDQYFYSKHKLITECQKELPRNQECEIVITAVVKEEKK